MGRVSFFRNAALALCGNPQIELALRDCIGSIRDHIPVDHMVLLIYEPDLNAMRTIASASSTEAQNRDVLIPLTEPARKQLGQRLNPSAPAVVIINSAEKVPVAEELLRFYGLEGSSILGMTLSTEGGRLGGVSITAEGTERYNQHHADLFFQLRDPFAIALSNTLRHREVIRLQERLADENRFLRGELNRHAGDEIIGADFGLKEVMRMVRQVALTESPVLLTGETGVGKDIVAGALHLASVRRDGPFIAVNCGSIPESLIDSELFGHEKGAFTGALNLKRGRFERAHKGTIFLDEIGDMPLSAQVRLLRVLQNKEIERIGGSELVPVDIRVLAASNRDLKDMIASGRFREDLWFRLNVFPIAIPPLRDRTSDIPALVRHFVELKAKELKLGFTPRLAPGSIEKLKGYSWPGNVRELSNVVERAMILCRDGLLSFELYSNTKQSSRTIKLDEAAETFPSLDLIIEEHIRRALELTNGKIHGTSGAGELLGVNPNTLRHRMKKLGILLRHSRF